MSLHSYSRCWVHLIWGTLHRERLLHKEAAARLSRYLTEYADTKGVYMKINYVNADHVHALIDLPTGMSIEELIQFLKGSSSHWINANNILPGNFAWEKATAHFLFRNRMSRRLLLTLPGRRNIIDC
jgi:REP element-mobilizing transposase RayT